MNMDTRALAALFAASALLAACGGGGSSQSPSPPPPPPAAPIVVTLSSPSLSASATPATGSQTAFVNISVTGATGSLFVGASSTHRGIELLRMSGQYLDALQLQVVFREAGTLPNDVYGDTVLVDVCKDKACKQPVAGSPFTLPVDLLVSGSSATAIPRQGAQPGNFLAHDVVDAAMSKPLGAIVMASAQPTSTLYVYDLASASEKSIALDKPPTSLSLSPDGRKVAVGHDAMVSYIDLTNIASAVPTVREVAVPTIVWDLVLDADDFVQAFPAADQWVDLYTVDMVDGTNAPTAAQLYAKTRARLHPAGDRMYVLDTQLSPENINRYSITGGMPAHTGQAPYWGDWAMCGNLWFSEAGDRIYTACGNTFTSSADLAQDMLYAGQIPLTNPAGYYPNIVWLDDSSAAGEAAYLDAGQCGGSGGSDCDTLLRVTENAHDNLRGAWWLPPVFVDGEFRVQHGLFVFHVPDGSLRLVGRLAGMADPTRAYYIVEPLAAGTNALLQRAAPVRATAR